VCTAYDEWPDPIPGSEYGEVKYEVRRADWRGLTKRAAHNP
jgi:hypothetical protein